jgi:23S rRNA (cytosine1962-C5)-methyltransferase
MKIPEIILRRGKEEALNRRHLWVFSGAIYKIIGNVSDGDLVHVKDAEDNLLALGHYNAGSIAVRIISFDEFEQTQEFWNKRIAQCFDYRNQLGLTSNGSTNAYRLVFGEGDGLPGLVIDFYNGTAVVQCHSTGMYLQRELIAEALKNLYKNKLQAIYLKCRETLSYLKSDEIKDEYLYGNAKDEQQILENNIHFLVDWVEGQKTGFFLDQRENRAILADYSHGKSVLNTFCYSGGFSIYALKAGATYVCSVDSSAKAMELTDKNVVLNGYSEKQHKSVKADVVDFLTHSDEEFDIIILDPPAYAKHVKTRHKAMMGYKRLNELALRKIKKGGFLFTFSCSQVVDFPLFKSTVIAAAIQCNRNVRIVQQLFQPPDHPVNAFHPESEYLKGLILYID